MKSQSLRQIAIMVLLWTMCIPLALAQSMLKVHGTVTDNQNEPLIGVSVREKGTNNASVSDLDGNYTLSVSKGSTLVFTYVGYTSQEQKVTSSTLNVTLLESKKILEEVVIVGYGVQKKSSVTGAISQVRSEDMQNRTISNAQQALQGKTAGVQVISAAAPGGAPTIRVRGYSSNGPSNPLFVVDGVRLSNISGIDPTDIASIEVLKDAASAAIYGAEAGNGVVLISTKKGKDGVGKITYDYQYASQALAKIPTMLNAEEYINYMDEAKIFKRADVMSVWDGKTDTKWTDVAFENSLMTKHSIAFQNGNNKGNYYLSLGYLNNNGIVKGDADIYERLSATINGEYEIKPWIKVGSTNQVMKYRHRAVSEANEYGSLLTSVLLMDPLTPDTYAPDNLPASMKNAIDQGYTLLKDPNGNYYSVSQFYQSEQYHPMIMRDSSIPKNSGFSISGSIYADLKPFDGFTFTSRFGYRLSGNRSSTTTLPSYGNSRSFTRYNAQSNTSSTSIYYQWENFANYMKTFGGHTLTAMAGISFQQSSYDYVTGTLSANGEDALLKNEPGFYYLNFPNSSATKGVAGETTYTSKYSYFGRLSYDYLGRYMLQASLRADAADLAYLPSTNRWGYFPAVSAGWAISEENFFQPLLRVVSSLKLRASWGQNGSLASLGNYQYSTDMTKGTPYALSPGLVYTTAVSPATMGNDKLKWETSEQINFGIDARFFKNRMSLSIDYFDKKTKDLLMTGTTPSLIIGGTTSTVNAGNVSNKGFEMEIGWRDQIDDFSYSVRGNLATLKNKVTYLDPSLVRVGGASFHNQFVTYFESGYPIYYFRGYKFKGIDAATGEPEFYDVDGDGSFTENDKTDIGNAIPKVTYGITLTAAYKGVDLTVFATGAAGNKIWNCINRPDYIQSNKLKEIFYDNRWTESNPNGTVPFAGARGMETYLRSDALVYDGSYLKIKQIQIGYTLPKKLFPKKFVKNIRIYGSLDDFFTFTSYPGFDPETSVSAVNGMGIDKGSYPGSKKMVLGINVEF